jgi:hypothetical protein
MSLSTHSRAAAAAAVIARHMSARNRSKPPNKINFSPGIARLAELGP